MQKIIGKALTHHVPQLQNYDIQNLLGRCGIHRFNAATL